MTEPFERRLVEAVRVDAEVRARGKFGWFARMVARPGMKGVPAGPRTARFSRAAVMSAVSEAAAEFAPADREAFDTNGVLPEWFWPWVEDRARWWDDNVPLH